ncbi:4-phosphoerythronate dehydrogenase PdxB [Pseudomonas sp.]|uniref:4-phosphoerythronate dehydrogenase PdxB n=1 Tax=Pseudomonas sp. TaxID=306 RepID=UPI00272C2951|nr:4-phosphoerythronate dehydrogenase PdxB [Pseudomonas sp.]
MRIIADENIPLIDAFFSDFGDVVRLPGRTIAREHVLDADALILRSVTRVDAAVLAGTPVRFVGTCTIGTDHLDLAGLNAAGIDVASAPGCNARGVVEYVLSCMLSFSEMTGKPWRQQIVGIVGVGQVGGRLAATLAALGVQTLLCDPPRAARGESGFVSLDALLEQADVISLHVPLERTGLHPTRHLLDANRLSQLRPGAWLINSSRGPVVDNVALRELLLERDDLQVALDVWEGEPEVDLVLARLCRLATPHIAGYSLDGKLRGTEQIYQAFSCHVGRPARLKLEQLAPLQGRMEWLAEAGAPADWLLCRALRYVYDVRDDDARFRAMLAQAGSVADVRQGFDRLRRDYPLRRECDSLKISVRQGMEAPTRALLRGAGLDC